MLALLASLSSTRSIVDPVLNTVTLCRAMICAKRSGCGETGEPSSITDGTRHSSAAPSM